MIYTTAKRKLRVGRVMLALVLFASIVVALTTLTLVFFDLFITPINTPKPTPSAGEATVYPDEPKDIEIVIDPGHGWTDVGAVRGSVEERMINASLSYKLAKKLQFYGYQVFFSHDISYATHVPQDIQTLLPKIEDKYDIENELVPAINKSGAHIMISVHHNAMHENEHPLTGFEAFYRYNNSSQAAESIALATAITNSMTNLDFLAPKEQAVVSGEYLINLVEMPSILLEVGYMSNAVELSKLIVEENQDEIAEEIALGIVDFFGRD